MSAWSKLFIAVGIILLLGLGLCGASVLGTASAHSDDLGLPLLGLGLCIVAVLVLIIGVIWLAATQDPTGPRPPPPPPPPPQA